MELQEVKTYLESNGDNEEVKAYLQDLRKVSVEGMAAYMEQDAEAKKWLDSTKDKHFHKALETWKTNNLEQLIDGEVKRRFPEKDEKDIELEKLKQAVEQMKTEKEREVLVNKAIKVANEKHLPLELVDFFIAQNEEATLENVTKFEGVFQQAVQAEVEQRLKGKGYIPPAQSQKATISLEALKGMTAEEINKNWDTVKQVLKTKQ